jgi:hypothetical protein
LFAFEMFAFREIQLLYHLGHVCGSIGICGREQATDAARTLQSAPIS